MLRRYGAIRSPQGRFITHQEAIAAWLPRMLMWSWNQVLDETLAVLVGYCSRRAGELLEMQGKQVTEGYEPRYGAVDKWLRMREILTRTRAEIKAVWDA